MKDNQSLPNCKLFSGWLTPERSQELASLPKVVGRAVIAITLMAIVAPSSLKLMIVKTNANFLAVGIALRVLYLFSPYKSQLKEFGQRLVQGYKQLVAAQKLYVNVCIFACAVGLFVLAGGTPIARELIVLLLLFCAYVAAYDALRFYKTLSEKLLGKAVIAIGFVSASNLAYSLAGQVVSDATHVTPMSLGHTTAFIAIMMIPVMMAFAGVVIYFVGTLMSGLVMLTAIGGVDPRLTKWLFAGTMKPGLRPGRATRLFQVVFYIAMGAMIMTWGQRSLPAYEKAVTAAVPWLVYNFDMYAGRECKLPSEYKLAPLGDSKFLLARMSSSGAISFEPPVRCDNLPPVEDVIGKSK